MKKQKIYTETEYIILKARYDSLYNHHIKSDSELNEKVRNQENLISYLNYEIKELRTPFYIKLMRKKYDKIFYIFIALSFLYFFFHFITL